MVNQLQERSTESQQPSPPTRTGTTQFAAATSRVPTPGTSTFVLVYHRSPYDEKIDASGLREWVDQKSPNGIIPTLRNLFQEERGGTWISWREDAEAADTPDERLSIDKDGQSFALRRLPLTLSAIPCAMRLGFRSATRRWPMNLQRVPLRGYGHKQAGRAWGAASAAAAAHRQPSLRLSAPERHPPTVLRPEPRQTQATGRRPHAAMREGPSWQGLTGIDEPDGAALHRRQANCGV
jgi:hypothetical protein